jgi:hypothetical protein
VRWDVGAELGALQRFTRGGDAGAPRPTIGPGAALLAHVALVPMVRLGAYVAYDASPVDGRSVRELVEGGVRLKVTPPILPRPWRAWLFAGLGYAWAFQPSYALTPAAGSAGPVVAPAVEGGILDLPFGLGIGWRVQPEWTVFAELGGRASLIAAGAMEEAPHCLCPGAFVGKDSFAVGLSLGVSWEQ